MRILTRNPAEAAERKTTPFPPLRRLPPAPGRKNGLPEACPRPCFRPNGFAHSHQPGIASLIESVFLSLHSLHTHPLCNESGPNALHCNESQLYEEMP